MNTCAPSATKRCAVARPMPLLPPVITATFPSSLPMMSLLFDRKFLFCTVQYRCHENRHGLNNYLPIGTQPASNEHETEEDGACSRTSPFFRHWEGVGCRDGGVLAQGL